MILTCPTCGTQYVVKDGAIPPGGRQVRCASCKHSWHQDQELAEENDPIAAAESDPPMAAQPQEPAGLSTESHSEGADFETEEGLAEATLIEPRSGPEAEERAYEEAALESSDEAAPAQPGKEVAAASNPYADAQFDIAKREEPAGEAQSNSNERPEAEAAGDEFSPFPAPDEEEPRHRSPGVAIGIVILIIIVLAIAFWLLAPAEWKGRLGLAPAGTSPLALVTTHMDRQRLESGNELLTVSGRVINPTGHRQDVPPLQAQLKTKAGKVVYSWTIPAPASSLAPGASAPFNSAEVNPPGGDELTISLTGAS
ncbi:MAG TPA: zinc-ribbon domain-containing protein [Sphingomicrobium sp.]|nr:zinc-ribbon domain-containing protein [Sphingomicrobium sp.]